jgi:hypothetical protein
MVSKYTAEQREAIMREARANLVRKVEPTPPHRDDEPSELESWRAEDSARKEEARRTERHPRALTDCEAAQLEQRLIAMIEEQRNFTLEVLAEALGEFAVHLADQASVKIDGMLGAVTKMVDGRFAELQRSISELRTRHARTANSDAEPVDPTNPPSRRLQ